MQIFVSDKGGSSWLYQSSLDFVKKKKTQIYTNVYKTFNGNLDVWQHYQSVQKLCYKELLHIENNLANYFLLECDLTRRARQNCGII